MAKYVDKSLGFPVFYEDGQGVHIPATAKKISEAEFQRHLKQNKRGA